MWQELKISAIRHRVNSIPELDLLFFNGNGIDKFGIGIEVC